MRTTLAAFAALAVATAFAPVGASAAPLQPSGISVPPNIDQVQYGQGFYRQGGYGYYNGYRGYGYYRPGYRRYGNLWFPGAAFAAGALVGGAIASQPEPVYGAPAAEGGDAHVQWCMQTYRSYRPSDDTFQPRNGPRQPCVSPY